MTRHIARTWLGAGALLATGALTLTACGSGFTDSGSAEQSSGGSLSILIGSSGDAETQAVEDAVAAWSKESGVDAKVQVANDLPQQLSQGFAAGSPPDLFYLTPDALAGYAANGSIAAYGDDLANKADFYPSLVENFTVDGKFYCAPKDFSTLALVINTDLWSAAGLTDADIPKTWDQLASVAQKLTADGRVGLAFGAEYQRVGAFMAQAGGGLLSDGTAAADSAANVEALQYVKTHLNDGSFAFASDVGAGWGGEAFGTQKAAMTIEGNWITGALTADYPDVKYTVAELPAGPGGKGTLQFTNCWGMAADSTNQENARALAEYLTGTDQQLAFSKAFGPMPSIQSAADAWSSGNPDLTAFLAGAEYAQFPPNIAGAADVITDFNAQLESLKTGDPQAILTTVQGNLEAIAK
ncbi:MAG: ABC transporter substrate-binding protein [Microbacterium sp. 71-36]|uniref:sugar ABC transporter substrate-binding protein n=1 Tax=unclassified Microbacterium TaxID=2609290 RepID=UPI00086867D5|nr:MULTISPECIES: extracellular solute-binding protein [unclassified Microbacterium]MBN9212422.1 extracellular solute-binding protein [Microbacterium sp.]ODT36774.1 MAG: sugar ABC transporter substrate-binding protein [Microbacterium sp. SCN 71-17]OJV77527.1 MAG: ABC transporter substrate-binding protein [Microbacterium sp. 71-36]